MRVSKVSRVFFHRVGSAERVLDNLRGQKYVGPDVPPWKQLYVSSKGFYQPFSFIRLARYWGNNPNIVKATGRIIKREGFNPEIDDPWDFIMQVEDAQRMNGLADGELESKRDFLTEQGTTENTRLSLILRDDKKRKKLSESSRTKVDALERRKIYNHVFRLILDVIDREMLPEGTTLTSELEQYKTKYRGRIVSNGLFHDEKLKNYLLALMYCMQSYGSNPLNKEDVEILYEQVYLIERNVDLLERITRKMGNSVFELKQIAEEQSTTAYDLERHYEIRKEYLEQKRTFNYLNAYFEMLAKGLAA